jgi:uncharacterized protein with HEPN domain
MQLETKKYFHDIQQAVERLSTFTVNKSLSDYEADALLRAGVERQFEIIGEALSRLARIDNDVLARITDYQRIIAFRNILIHGYAEVDDRVVWDIVESKLPLLRREIETLIAQD